MFVQLVMWSFLLLPWLLLIPLDKPKVKRYFPAGLFGALVLTFVFQMAEKFDWWEIKQNIVLLDNITPFVYGVFLVGTVIILYFTYERFIVFFVTNLIVDSFLSFGLSKWYEYLGIYELINMNEFGVLLLTTVIALLIYLYQKWQDGAMIKEEFS
ncbi:hypothetical protein LG311_08135 [Sutcliffiella horikoshii]|uniref:hypothetical protein n=1 Tax=Sutcliffiella horikoshii TaxID=79883 RepID=UPI00384DEA80